MIVEDEMFVRIGLEHALNWEDYQLRLVPSASNGREALENYRKYRPNLIITDIKMPEMDGLELIAAIRSQDRNVKFIVLTCMEDYQTAKQALNLSVSFYYNKSDLDVEKLASHLLEIVSELSLAGPPAETPPEEDEADRRRQEALERFFSEGTPCDLPQLLQSCQRDRACYALALAEFFYSEQREADEVYRSLVENLLLETLKKQKGGSCLAVFSQYAVLFYALEASSPERRVEQLSDYLSHLESVMRSYFNISLKITVSPFFEALDELPSQWEETQRQAREETSSSILGLPSQKIFAMVQYVREHLSEDLTLSVMAEYVNFSPSYLGSLFRREMGVTFSEFVLNMRIRRVKQLLEEDDRPLSAIAEQTGLYDASYLVKVFKKAVGITPNEYRQQRRAKTKRYSES